MTTSRNEQERKSAASSLDALTHRLRNIGLVAHINAGKTTLSERVLFTTGKQRVMGEVDEGTATMDYLAEEQQRGISITAAVTRVGWKGYAINLIDTPGHVDFTAEVERSLRVLDGVVVVLDGVRGVESQTQTVWRQADRRGIPRLVLVNKMDRTGADFAASVASLRDRLGCEPVPILIPLQRDGALVGLLDVISGEAKVWGGEPEPVDVLPLRAAVVEACADFDETILADFVEDRVVDEARIHAALRLGVLAGRVVPVLSGTALHNRGVAELLDAVCRYLPSPLEEGAGVQASDLAVAPLRALVFKTIVEDGESLYMARVYSGRMQEGDLVGFGAEEREVEIGTLWLLHADHREDMASAGVGEVVAFEAKAPLRTGDTLYSVGSPEHLEPVRFPQPVVSSVLEPRASTDAALLETAARALAADDPTLVVEPDPNRGGLVVSGMGELHLGVFGSRLRRRIGERARLGRPVVAYMETVAGSGAGRAECRAPGDGSMSSVVAVEIRHVPDSEARVESRVPPTPRADALLDALAVRLRSGLADPYPALDLSICLTELAGSASGDEGAVLDLEALSVACRKAVAAARPVLLVPIMSFEVECPTDTLSGVLADLKSRAGQIEHVDSSGKLSQVRGAISLEPMLGYATQLRSLTRGLGTLVLSPRGHAPATPSHREKGGSSLDPSPRDR